MVDSSLRPTGRGAGRAVAAAALALLAATLLPIFLRMPRWCDSYFYDTCAATILRGDRLYEEHLLFGVPGMPLLQAGVRAVLGWSNVALRAFDAAVLVLAAWWLGRLAAADRSAAARLWLAFAVVLFHTGNTEWCHCQPDQWMLAPALAALLLRARRCEGRWGPGFAEGLCWGVALAIKPFVALPAAAAALVAWRVRGFAWRSEAAVAAGVAAVAAGCLGWIFLTGSWPAYRAAAASPWSREIYAKNLSQWPARIADFFQYGTPWAYVQVPAALAGAWLLTRAGRPGGLRPALVAAAYFGWAVQAHFVQTQFGYQTAPAFLLGLAACWPATAGAWGRRAAAVAGVALAASHPLLRPDILRHWPACFQPGEANALRLMDDLSVSADDVRIRFQHLDRAAQYLRRQGVGDRDLECFSVTALPLYTWLNVRTPHPYLMPTVFKLFLPDRAAEMVAEMRRRPRRYIVTDDLNPLDGGMAVSHAYPRSEPVVFQAGRFAVRAASPP
jgi:hypothetical protein